MFSCVCCKVFKNSFLIHFLWNLLLHLRVWFLARLNVLVRVLRLVCTIYIFCGFTLFTWLYVVLQADAVVWECSIKKVKTPMLESFFVWIKLLGWRHAIKKTSALIFPKNLVKFLKTSILYNICKRLLLYWLNMKIVHYLKTMNKYWK